MKNTLIYILITSSLLIAGCKKNADTGAPAPSKHLLQKDVFYTDAFKDSIVYHYDELGRLTSFVQQTELEKLSYNSNNQVTVDEHYSSQRLTTRTVFSYSDGKITSQVSRFDYNGNVFELYNDTYILDSNKHLTRYNSVLDPVYYAHHTTFTYDGNGNCLSYQEYFDPNSTTKPDYVFTLTYDNKKNKFGDVVGTYYIYPNIGYGTNNILTNTDQGYDSNYNRSDLLKFSYTYEYNAEGYPTKCVEVNPTKTYTSNGIIHYYTYIVQ